MYPQFHFWSVIPMTMNVSLAMFVMVSVVPGFWTTRDYDYKKCQKRGKEDCLEGYFHTKYL